VSKDFPLQLPTPDEALMSYLKGAPLVRGFYSYFHKKNQPKKDRHGYLCTF